MDFNAIAAKLRQIDEAPMPAIPGAPQMPEPKPSISVNMNAQGAEGIEDLLKVLSKIESGDDEGADTMLPPGHDADHQVVKTLDKDGDLDHDMDDHKEEAYANEPDEEIEDIDYLVNKLAGGMNRPKGTHTKVSSADNPLQKVSAGESVETEKTDLRSQIRAELAQKLSEMKGE